MSLLFPLQLLPSLYEAGRNSAPGGDLMNCILTDAAAALGDEFNKSIQVQVHSSRLHSAR